ncbi:unnamed protein product [Pylaiella littoralis]
MDVEDGTSQTPPTPRPQGRGGGVGGHPQSLLVPPQPLRSPTTGGISSSSSYLSLGAGDSTAGNSSSGNRGVGAGGAWAGRRAGAAAAVAASAAAAAAVAAAAAATGQRGQQGAVVFNRNNGHVESNCPFCGHFFERLVSHLSRGKKASSCGNSQAGRALLKRLRSTKSLVLDDADAAAAAAAPAPATPASRLTLGAVVAAGGGVGGGRESEGRRGAAAAAAGATGAGSRVKDKEQQWPCPVCAKSFQRIGTHIQFVECRLVQNLPPSATMECRRCGEIIGVTLELLKEHSTRCSIADNNSSSSTAAVTTPSESSPSSLTVPGPTAAAAAATAAPARPPPRPSGLGLADPSPHHELARSSSSNSSAAGGSASPRGSGSTSSASSTWRPRAAAGKSGTGTATSKRRASTQSGGSGGGGGGGRASPSLSGGGSRGSGGGGGGGGTAPPRLKRRASASSAASAASVGSGGSAHAWGSGIGRRGPHHLEYRRPSLADATSGGSFSSGRALGCSDSDSDPGTWAGAGAGAGNTSWFGVGGAPGGGIIGAMRRPMPPKKRWETAFEAWAREGEDKAGGQSSAGGGLGVEEAALVEVEDRYPTLVKRAEESGRVTVREVRAAAESGGRGGGGGGEGGREIQAVVVCNLVVTGGSERKRGRPNGTAVAHLGLEISEKASAGSSAFGRFPVVVVAVAAGGAADSAGVAAGARILQVEGLSMEEKSTADVVKTMSDALKESRSSSSNGASTGGVTGAVRLVIVTPPWSAPPPPPAPAPAPAAGGANKTESPVVAGVGAAAAAAAGHSHWEGMGGMACLARKGNKGREFVELCWSVLMVSGGGVPPPTDVKASAATVGERPAAQEEEVARRLGFDVERRELSQGMECIEVSSVSADGLAARHGLRTKDLLLAVDGNHLLSATEPSFWLEVGRTLRACDSAFRKGANNPTAASITTTTASTTTNDTTTTSITNDTTSTTTTTTTLTNYGKSFPVEHEGEESWWLRFLVFRRGAPPSTTGFPTRGSITATGNRRPFGIPQISATAAAAAAAAVGTKKQGIDWRLPRQQPRELPGAGAAAAEAAATGNETGRCQGWRDGTTSESDWKSEGGRGGGRSRPRAPTGRF